MELNCTIALLFQLFMCSNIMSFAINYMYYNRDNIDCATEPLHVESIVKHGKTDKAVYLL